MRCIYCNTQLGEEPYCPGCGADVTLLKRIGTISNLLYNRGLEKAQVRDLSGAITVLAQSLKFNKENTDARNLLGLCYYETGEVVSALCEWVISKNISPDHNLAEQYINTLQNNKNQLDTINQSIRKYNQSIEYCREGHDDMAIMQLKKVVSMNPKLVKAQQLLALLYMKSQDYDKARRLLRRALAVDNTNTTSLRYLDELEQITGKSYGRHRKEKEEEQDRGGTLHYLSGTETIIQPTTFRDSSAVATFINIFLGILLGGAIVWFMAVPAATQRTRESANQSVTDANLQLASSTAQIEDLQDQVEEYQSEVDSANTQRDDALAKADSYEDLMDAANLYVTGEQTGAVDALSSIDGDSLDGSAKTLYESLSESVSSTMFNQYYTAGTTAYAGGDYQTAAQQLQLAVDTDSDGQESNFYNALYYLAFSYYFLGDSANADKYLNELIERYPNQASTFTPYLSSNSGTSTAGTVTSQGEASLNQDQAGTYQADAGTGTAAGGDSTASGTGEMVDGQYADTTSGQSGTNGSTAQIAWTDPTTGQGYDAYGNPVG